MHGLLAQFLSESFAVLILHKPGFRGCHGESIIEIGDKGGCWNNGKGGVNSSLLVHSRLWDVGRGKTKKHKMSKRKSWACSSNSSRAGNWWLPFLLGVHYLKQCWIPAFPVSFFAQLLEGVCAGSSPGLGKESTRELCGLPLQSLEQTIPKSAMAAGTGSFGENSCGKSGNSQSLGREARPFSKPKSNAVWVSLKLFNEEKARENQIAKAFFSLFH